MYRIDRAAGSGGPFAGNTGFERQFLLELVVHVEHIAGANDVAFADFNRRRMHHRPGGFGGGAGKYALRPGTAGSSPVVRLVLLALKTKAGLRLRRTSLATVLAPPRSAKSGKGRGGT